MLFTCKIPSPCYLLCKVYNPPNKYVPQRTCMQYIRGSAPPEHQLKCIMVTWTRDKNHLLEACLTQNWTHTTIDLFCFIMCEDLHG